MRLPYPSQRVLGVLGLALALLCGGCFLDEIDKAAGWQQPADEKVEAPAAVSKPAGGMERPNWWASAKSLGSEESKTDIVRCSVGKTTQFTGREDCLARGGRVE